MLQSGAAQSNPYSLENWDTVFAKVMKTAKDKNLIPKSIRFKLHAQWPMGAGKKDQAPSSIGFIAQFRKALVAAYKAVEGRAKTRVVNDGMSAINPLIIDTFGKLAKGEFVVEKPATAQDAQPKEAPASSSPPSKAGSKTEGKRRPRASKGRGVLPAVPPAVSAKKGTAASAKLNAASAAALPPEPPEPLFETWAGTFAQVMASDSATKFFEQELQRHLHLEWKVLQGRLLTSSELLTRDSFATQFEGCLKAAYAAAYKNTELAGGKFRYYMRALNKALDPTNALASPPPTLGGGVRHTFMPPPLEADPVLSFKQWEETFGQVKEKWLGLTPTVIDHLKAEWAQVTAKLPADETWDAFVDSLKACFEQALEKTCGEASGAFIKDGLKNLQTAVTEVREGKLTASAIP